MRTEAVKWHRFTYLEGGGVGEKCVMVKDCTGESCLAASGKGTGGAGRVAARRVRRQGPLKGQRGVLGKRGGAERGESERDEEVTYTPRESDGAWRIRSASSPRLRRRALRPARRGFIRRSACAHLIAAERVSRKQCYCFLLY